MILPALLLTATTTRAVTAAELKKRIEEAQAIGQSCIVELENCAEHKTALREMIYSRDLRISELKIAIADRPAPPSPSGRLSVAILGVIAGAACGAAGGASGAHFDGVRGAAVGGAGGSLLCAATVLFLGR